MLKKISLVALALCVAGCATKFGNNFNSTAVLNLTPGVTTRTEALNSIASTPTSSETTTIKKDVAGKDLKEPIVVERMFYYFRDMNATPSVVEKEPKRYAWLSFAGDKLIGYWVASTFRDDSTNFDESRVKSLEKGKTTQQDTLRLLGTPSGKAIYPAASEIDGSRWYYKVRWWADNRMHAKTLRVDFDKSQVLTDFDLNIGAE
ncbi:MAG: outer membrane protein assembly factor BamE [Aquabacterium sp.]